MQPGILRINIKGEQGEGQAFGNFGLPPEPSDGAQETVDTESLGSIVQGKRFIKELPGFLEFPYPGGDEGQRGVGRGRIRVEIPAEIEDVNGPLGVFLIQKIFTKV